MTSRKTRLPDADARRRIREDVDVTFVVEAAAGTGKTTTLIQRIVALLEAGRTRLGQLVAVTFTDKAAGEMKLRLRTALEAARQKAAPTARARLELALSELEVARIATIHSLCADILRERPIEAQVDPLFEVASAEDARRLLESAFRTWFEQSLEDPPEGIRRLLRRRPRGRDAKSPREQLFEAAWTLIEHRDFGQPWRRPTYDRRATLDRLVERLSELGALADRARRPSKLQDNLREVKRFVDDLLHRERVSERDHDGLEALLFELSRRRSWHHKGFGDEYGPGLSRAAVLERRAAVLAELEAFFALANADLAACLRDELRPLVEAYAQRKVREGVLDFFDLQLRVRDLLRDNAAIRRDLQQRTSHLFVDEFQDTDPLQAEILLLLAAADHRETALDRLTAAPGKLFLVGDPKQSIYRFRRADIALYERVKRQLVQGGAEVLHLTTSFRGTPALQEAINQAFCGPMAPGPGHTQPEYVPLQQHRDALEGQPAVVALPVPRPYAPYGKIANYRVEESTPDAVAAFVDFLVRHSGWKVTDAQSNQPVPIAARHVCLLFRRLQSFGRDVTREYTRALEARGLPHVLVGGRSFFDREEVRAVRNALEAIEWPDDELAVYACLKGPLFALSDEALLVWRESLGKLHPLRRVDAAAHDGPLGEVAGVLAVLGELHLGRNRRTIGDTLTRLFETTRAHAAFATWTDGEQALANLMRVVELARRFEVRGASSFRAFVERLAEDARAGEGSEAPLVEEGTEGVRIMTVHRAKGLEFPVVVLAEPTAPAVGAVATRHVEAATGTWAESLAGCAPQELLDHQATALRMDQEEALRLAYVAATRARDLLVVPAVGDEAVSGWYDVLHPVIYPPHEKRREAAPAPGCPPLGNDSVLERPESCPLTALASVAPGEHRPQLGSHRVTWWDPAALELDRRPSSGLRMQEALEDDRAGAAEAGRREFARWSEGREDTLSRGGQPSLPVRSVRELSVSTTRPSHAIERCRPAVAPGGARYGALVHAVLADVELGATPNEVLGLTTLHGRLLGADATEVDFAARAVGAALDHPVLRRARAATACCRESLVTIPGPEQALIEGVIDLAFLREGEWTVVEFKTDTNLEDNLDAHLTQLSHYVDAVARITKLSTRGVLFWL